MRTSSTKKSSKVLMSARVPRKLRDDLKEFASRLGIPLSQALTRLLEEGLRRERHPGIDFRFVPGGRRAFVTGTGLTVWEMCRILKDHQEDMRKVLRNYPHLRPHQVRAAAAYARVHPKEIQEDFQRALPERPLEEFPYLKSFRV